MHKLIKLLHFIDNVNEWMGKIVSFFIFAIIGIIIYEVLTRYLLVISQSWVPEMSTFLFGALFTLGGGYGVLHQSHVRLDLLYNSFSPRVRAVFNLVTSIFLFLFCGVIIWKGWLMAWDSLITLEKSPSAFAPPLFPIKLTIPIGAGLFFLQGIVNFIRDLFTAIKGEKVEC